MLASLEFQDEVVILLHRDQREADKSATVECMDNFIPQSDSGLDTTVQSSARPKMHCHCSIASYRDKRMWTMNCQTILRRKVLDTLSDSLNHNRNPHDINDFTFLKTEQLQTILNRLPEQAISVLGWRKNLALLEATWNLSINS